jgi:phosphatidylglycerophosphate synthase
MVDNPSEAPMNMPATPPSPARRPLKTRDAKWVHALAASLARRGVTPNQISIASIACAVLAGVFIPIGTLVPTGVGTAALLLAAVCIQLRLLCNLVDGIVAVEGGRATKSGEVFNDLPDRVSDVVIFVAAGYAASVSGVGPVLGWICALLAVMTAYVRVLRGSTGLRQDFGGPMAKPHRMAVLTGACVAAAILPAGWRGGLMVLALAVVSLGCLLTLWLRTTRLMQDLEAR